MFDKISQRIARAKADSAERAQDAKKAGFAADAEMSADVQENPRQVFVKIVDPETLLPLADEQGTVKSRFRDAPKRKRQK